MSWFFSVAGQRFATLNGITCAIGAFSVFYLPNSKLLDWYKETTHLYKAGLPLPLAPSVVDLCEKVKKDLKLTEDQNERTKFYYCYGFDFVKQGCTHRFSPIEKLKGAIVGIPSNFDWTENENLPSKNIILAQKPVEWSQPSGQRLKESLFLSEDAKKFAIAINLYRTSTLEPLDNGLVAATATILTMVYAKFANRKFGFAKGPRIVRYGLYSLLALFNFAFFLFSVDINTLTLDGKVDEKVAELGIDYIKGGEEFITKTMQRNVAFREILGDKGEKYFTATGNENFFIRTKNKTLSSRLDMFKKLKAEYLENNDKSKNV